MDKFKFLPQVQYPTVQISPNLSLRSIVLGINGKKHRTTDPTYISLL